MSTISEDSTPEVTLQHLEACLSKAYGLTKGSLEAMYGFDDLNFHFVPKCSSNPFVKTPWPHGYVVKIMNAKDSLNDGLCDAQNKLLLFLNFFRSPPQNLIIVGENDIPSPKIVKTVKGDYYIKEKFPKTPSGKQRVHIVRLFEYQIGTTLKATPKSYPTLYKLGIFLGKLDKVLKEFSHTFYESHGSVWHLKSVPELRHRVEVVKCPRKKELVENIIEKFIENVQTKVETFEKGMIHGDFNEHNVLMSFGSTREWEVSAILDFGDSHYSNYLFDLAIAMCYMMFECKREGLDLFVGTGHLLAGYLAIRPTFLVDLSLLKTCICARICQSLVLGLHASKTQPQNEYVLDSQTLGWQILEEVWEVSEEQVIKQWDSVVQSYNIKRLSTNSS